jgi:hypothetical protein
MLLVLEIEEDAVPEEGLPVTQMPHWRWRATCSRSMLLVAITIATFCHARVNIHILRCGS